MSKLLQSLIVVPAIALLLMTVTQDRPPVLESTAAGIKISFDGEERFYPKNKLFYRFDDENVLHIREENRAMDIVAVDLDTDAINISGVEYNDVASAQTAIEPIMFAASGGGTGTETDPIATPIATAAQTKADANETDIATNTTAISTIQTQQTTQDTSIAANASAITTIQTGQTTQDAIIALNTADRHSPVTLGAGSDTALALAGQEVTLTLPDAWAISLADETETVGAVVPNATPYDYTWTPDTAGVYVVDLSADAVVGNGYVTIGTAVGGQEILAIAAAADRLTPTELARSYVFNVPAASVGSALNVRIGAGGGSTVTNPVSRIRSAAAAAGSLSDNFVTSDLVSTENRIHTFDNNLTIEGDGAKQIASADGTNSGDVQSNAALGFSRVAMANDAGTIGSSVATLADGTIEIASTEGEYKFGVGSTPQLPVDKTTETTKRALVDTATGRIVLGPDSDLAAVRIDSSAAATVNTLAATTDSGVVQLFTNIDVTNSATLAVQAGETLNGVTDGSFLFSNYSSGTQFRADEVTGGWTVSVAGSSNSEDLIQLSVQGILDDASTTAGDWVVPIADLIDYPTMPLDVVDNAGVLSGSVVTIPTGKGGFYDISAVVDHPSNPLLGSNGQNAIGVAQIAIRITPNGGTAYLADLALDSRNGVPDEYYGAGTFRLADGDTVELVLPSVDTVANEDFIVRFTLMERPTHKAVLAGMVAPTPLAYYSDISGSTSQSAAEVDLGPSFTIPSDGDYEVTVHLSANLDNTGGNSNAYVTAKDGSNNNLAGRSWPLVASTNQEGANNNNQEIGSSDVFTLTAGTVVKLRGSTGGTPNHRLESNCRLTVRQLPSSSVVMPDALPVEDLEVVLFEDLTGGNASGADIGAAWNSLAGLGYKQVRFEAWELSSGNSAFLSASSTIPVEAFNSPSGSDDWATQIILASTTSAQRIEVRGTNSGTTINPLYVGSVTTSGLVNFGIRVVGIKAQKTVVMPDALPVEPLHYMQAEWSAAGAPMAGTILSESAGSPIVLNPGVSVEVPAGRWKLVCHGNVNAPSDATSFRWQNLTDSVIVGSDGSTVGPTNTTNRASMAAVAIVELTDTKTFSIQGSTVFEGDTNSHRPHIEIIQLPTTTTVIASEDTPVNDQAASGYIDIGTTRIQWGTETLATGSDDSVTFPFPFASTPSIVVSPANRNGAVLTVFTDAETATGFQVNRRRISDSNAVPGDITWHAIGIAP